MLHTKKLGRFGDESTVASVDRPALNLYRSSRVVYDKTRYDKLLKVTTNSFYEYT